MKIKFLMIGLLCYCFSNAQKFGDTSSFILKGHISNLKNNYFEFRVSGILKGEKSSIILDNKGNFFKSIQIENTQQSISLMLNDNFIRFTIGKNDTVNIECDANQFNATFTISAQDIERTNALNIQKIQSLEFFKPLVNLQTKLYQDKSLNDSAKFELINTMFNKELRLIIDSSKFSNFDILYPDAYFRYSYLLFNHKLIPKFKLIADTLYIKDYTQKMAIKYTTYSELFENLFWKSESYREFIYDYLRLSNLFYYYSGKGENNFNPTLDNYYLAKGAMKIIPIKNWFITKCILDDYGNYKIDDVAAVNDMFLKELGDSDLYLKQLLIGKYTAVKTLKKGEPAPLFTLKDEKGKNVSLADFKGKIIYLDFWGVDCGPCIYDIDNYEKKLHEKYKGKDVVFISICVDSDESEWNAGMKKHNMNNEGINLIAEGWADNPVCKAYNVSGIPHYVLIDKEGKLVNNNARTMYELINAPFGNEIDELLSK